MRLHLLAALAAVAPGNAAAKESAHASSNMTHQQRRAQKHLERVDEAKTLQGVFDAAQHRMEGSIAQLNGLIKTWRAHDNQTGMQKLGDEAWSSASSSLEDKTKAVNQDFQNQVDEIYEAVRFSHNGKEIDAAQRAATRDSEQILKLAEEANRIAQGHLRYGNKKARAQAQKIYKKAKDAAREMLHVRSKLEKAQEKAGYSERTYEKGELRNELLAERLRDQAENLHETFDGLVSKVFNGAASHVDELLHQEEQSRAQRNHAVDKAVRDVKEIVAERNTTSSLPPAPAPPPEKHAAPAPEKHAAPVPAPAPAPVPEPTPVPEPAPAPGPESEPAPKPKPDSELGDIEKELGTLKAGLDMGGSKSKNPKSSELSNMLIADADGYRATLVFSFIAAVQFAGCMMLKTVYRRWTRQQRPTGFVEKPALG